MPPFLESIAVRAVRRRVAPFVVRSFGDLLAEGSESIPHAVAFCLAAGQVGPQLQQIAQDASAPALGRLVDAALLRGAGVAFVFVLRGHRPNFHGFEHL